MIKLSDKTKKILVDVRFYSAWALLMFLAMNGWMRLADNNTFCDVRDFSGEYVISYDQFKGNFCENTGFLNMGLECFPNDHVEVFCKVKFMGLDVKVIKSPNF